LYAWARPGKCETGVQAVTALVEALATEYPAGAGIGWHRDARSFGSAVIGVSLKASSLLRLRRVTETGRDDFRQVLAPRSAYVLRGPARSASEHSIPPVKELRFSVTFRSLLRKAD
jgi:DNA oxidative demethylase